MMETDPFDQLLFQTTKREGAIKQSNGRGGVGRLNQSIKSIDESTSEVFLESEEKGGREEEWYQRVKKKQRQVSVAMFAKERRGEWWGGGAEKRRESLGQSSPVDCVCQGQSSLATQGENHREEKQGQRREKTGVFEDRGRRDERKKTMIRHGIKTFPVLTVTRCSKQSDPFQSINCNNPILPMENEGKSQRNEHGKEKKSRLRYSLAVESPVRGFIYSNYQ